MTLNPEDRKNWQGFLELLQPPPGYRLVSALGTTFGLSFDALTAALLAMCEADGEALAANPVAAVTAITRLRDRVRVLVHPATIAPPPKSVGIGAFVALLDRMVVQVRPQAGLFHPKVWALRFERIGPPPPDEPRERGRLIVGSRNLTRSTSFELAAAFDGVPVQPVAGRSEVARDIGGALREWLHGADAAVPDRVRQVTHFIEQLALETSREGTDTLRLHWQGSGRVPLAGIVPEALDRALVVSPFLQPDFVRFLLGRTKVLQVVSIPETLDALPEETFALLDARARVQAAPVLYQVTGHGDPDDFHLDGVHAKMLLIEGPRQQTATFLGSANATGPGWGLGGMANVEAMLEMRPGLSLDGFVKGFIRDRKASVHPWIMEYDRAAKPEPDEVRDLERQLLAALRDYARLNLAISYDAARERLVLSREGGRAALAPALRERGVVVSFVPLLLSSRPDGWRPMSDIEAGTFAYEGVAIDQVSAFVVFRATSREPALDCQRMVVAKLNVAASDLDLRDDLLRRSVIESTDRSAVLAALIKGLAHLPTDAAGAVKGHGAGHGLRALMQETTLERLLQAVALDPSLVEDMKLLLGHDKDLLAICEVLQLVAGSTEEAVS